METSELLKKVRKIEIKTRGITNQVFSGEYHSKFKGKGMAFSEVREYMPGDDIRTIDWNVTARFNTPFVKVFEEERELTVMLLVDVSASGMFGSQSQLKRDVITEICAVLSFSAIQNNDKIGVIFFSDKIEKYIPPKKGRSHILRIIRDLIDFKAESRSTDITQALRFLNNVTRKRSIAFLISDFIDHNSFEDALKIANRKHDLVAINVYDKREMELLNVGLVQVKDSETGKSIWVDTGDSKVRMHYNRLAREQFDMVKNTFRRSGVDVAQVATHESYIKPLMMLFKKRV